MQIADQQDNKIFEDQGEAFAGKPRAYRVAAILGSGMA
ncbi:hypothetical protein C4K27_0722 [Pseudomonas chlororaphis subsp. chlororaphis]|nr:hypothetical protein C4K27_0722 [Pseudomonas chlororaphis subsp. chlororaphis]